MSEIVTIYRINCYASLDPSLVGESCSLLPWDGAGPDRQGSDDGGREYVLPEHYRQSRDEGGCPVVQDEEGCICELKLHNGCPLLIDEEKRLAHLLEPVRKMATYRSAAGMTMAELAQRLGVTQKEVYEWENLEKSPEEAILRQIADILGCDVSEIR